MKNILRVVLVLNLFLGSVTAQKLFNKVVPSTNSIITTNKTVQNNINILAVMVEFKEDNDGATYGKGTFGSIYTKEYGTSIIDPLPHDKTYFESHLKFAQNYYNKVSNGNVNVNYSVLPTVYKTSKIMREYSPVRDSKDFTPLGEFSQEVWNMVVANETGLDFSQYNLFVIFHAGVGRDVNITGSLGNDRDLPSVYLGFESLKKIFGADFVGFNTPNALIQNTLILPETESREISSVAGDVLLELSINGLIVSSIASHLGLPDLYNTETGLSAIGRFGLMDGQSIFAYSGLFPPEPSAWEKIYLGWETPSEITLSGIYNLSLPARLALELGSKSIVKIPINNNEYYLLENRQRDVYKDGANIKINLNGVEIAKHFPKDTTGFYSYSVDSLSGVVTDIDEFDWAVPGNGILIWHIDESVINANLATNTINNNKDKRGVDVEEADGIQDIGETFTTVFGDQVIGEGDSLDLWYLGNKAKLYKNVFDDNSKPDSKSNTGAKSLITIDNFSESSNKISFRVSRGSSEVVLNQQVDLGLPNIKSAVEFDNNQYLLIGNDLNYRTLLSNSILNYKQNFANTAISLVKEFGCVIGTFNNVVNFAFGLNSSKSITLPNSVSTLPVYNNGILYIGTEVGEIYKFVISNNDVTFEKDNSLSGTNKPVQIIANNNVINIVYENSISNTNCTINGDSFIQVVKAVNENGTVMLYALTANNKFYVIKDGSQISSFSVPNNLKVSSFISVDFLKEGNNQIVFADTNYIYVYNSTGSVVDGFPLKVNSNSKFSNYLLAADFDGDTYPELVYFTNEGNIYVYNPKLKKQFTQFPISVGSKLDFYPALSQNTGSSTISLQLVADLVYYNYNIDFASTNAKIYYTGLYGDLYNAATVESTSSENLITEFFPEKRVYNWPNPVYENSTNIRYYVSENSNVTIKIFDAAGDFVEELNTTAVGGMDNEISWNVSNIQSGVYFARVEAAGLSGKNGYKIIKIAVIK